MAILLTTTGIAFVVALVTRIFVDLYLAERISIIGSLIGLEHIENSGVAFGINFPPLIRIILIGCALVFVLHLAYQSRKKTMHAISFGLIIGGALANIVDRFDDGFVTDFIQVGWWPVFNVADSCITVGVLLLICIEFLLARKRV